MPYSGLEHIGWRAHAIAIMRMTVVAVITSVIIVTGLNVAYHGQQVEQDRVAHVLVDTNLAQACILALPSDPITGRDPALVKLCFTQYGLQPPKTLNP